MCKIIGGLGIAALLLSYLGCTPIEGERCNPQLFNDACGSGTQCTYPKNCGVAYCCPPPDKITPQTNSACQACPDPDGGTTD